jgi:hypothetical protein
MKYMLLLYGNEEAWAQVSDEERMRGMQAHMEYSTALSASGAHLAGAPLQPSRAATTVTVQDGERIVTDGPFAETKEQLAGYYLIECDTLDEALEWAERNPAAQWGGHVEVRPVMEIPAAMLEGGAA